MGIFDRFKKKTPSRGHVRLVVDPATGFVRDCEIVAPLVDTEVHPALLAAFRTVSEQTQGARAAQIADVHARVQKDAGMMDKLRGRAARWKEQAEHTVPGERFTGSAEGGAVTITVDGNLGFLTGEVRIGTPPDAVFAAARAAHAEACERCIQRWDTALRGALDGDAEEPAPA